MSKITWGVCRANDGSLLRTVFCLDCRETFGRRYSAGMEYMDIVEQAETDHVCHATDTSGECEV